ncbi:MAG: DNA mismatch repair protein MutS [Eubacteriales bacterium]|jgi:DNA mismatch repair protein MutS
MAELTPMMRQYQEIKDQYQDHILMYRLGDFYEMFFDDAKTVSEELDLVLTGRDCGQEERAPMCGVPYHSCEGYIARLIQKGYKVAVCEQMEDPKTAKGLVKRDVVRIITPGTVIESSMLEDNKNNYLACVYSGPEGGAVCFCDISTGEMFASAFEEEVPLRLMNELGKFMPREVLACGQPQPSVELFARERLHALYEPEKQPAALEEMRRRIREQFGREPEELGVEQPALVQAVGGLLGYLQDTQKVDLRHLHQPSVYSQSQFMDLDMTARRNLELTETMRSKEKKGSLLGVLDRTCTSMGGRLMRKWMEQPLVNPVAINRRLNAVGELKNSDILRRELAEGLRGLYDLERLISRVVYKTANARDLQSLAISLQQVPGIAKMLEGVTTSYLKELRLQCEDIPEVYELIGRAICDEPPFSVREGEIIREGYHPEVDRLRSIIGDAKGYIAAMEGREREKTGIRNLRIKYNKVFGYYIEVTRSNLDQVPENYIRKQTLTNCERFITEELKEFENTVINASGRITALEYELFCQVRDEVAGSIHRIQRTAHALAQLDVLCSFARVAADNRYVMPDVDLSHVIDIRGGRHPVVESMPGATAFVPNDTYLNADGSRAALITGPNMAGKSTYMRQTALIVLMAQMGSFVPADSAVIGVCDKIFTRVGASDDLASGQSTFMVEMNEVASILKNATPQSLVILDEIGRGTSTFDGLAIAQAVLEYTANPKKLGCKVMFATHYHELTELEGRVDGVKNYHVAVHKRGEDITFLRKIREGGTDDSFGIEVARLAGVPKEVLQRARAILRAIENGEGNLKFPQKREKAAVSQEQQVSMVSAVESVALKKLLSIDMDDVTPRQALDILYDLRRSIVKE